MMMDMFMAGYRVYPPAEDYLPAGSSVYTPVPLKPAEPARPILMYIMPHFVSLQNFFGLSLRFHGVNCCRIH